MKRHITENKDEEKNMNKKNGFSYKRVFTIIGSLLAGICTVTTIIVNLGQISSFRKSTSEGNTTISDNVENTSDQEQKENKVDEPINVQETSNSEAKEEIESSSPASTNNSEENTNDLGLENVIQKAKGIEIIESTDGTIGKPHADPDIKEENVEVLKLRQLWVGYDIEDENITSLIDGDISTAVMIDRSDRDDIHIVTEPDCIITHVLILPGLASDKESFLSNGRPDEISIVHDGDLARYYNKFRIDDFALDFNNPEIKAYKLENPIDYRDGLVNIHIESIANGDTGYISEMYLCGYKKE